MVRVLTRSWWALALGGVAAILFGILAFIWPAIALAVLIALFGAYALVDGIFALISAVRAGRAHGRWGALVLYGIIGIAAGIIAFVAPLVTAIALVAVVAAWAFITGGLEIAAAIRLRRTIRGEWLMVLAGVLSMILGVALVALPVIGAIALAMWIGAYMFVSGIVEVILAFRLRHWVASGEVPRSELRAA